MRRTFQEELYKRMMYNSDIFLLVGDLGYKMFDEHFKSFPERVFNFGAAEQSMMGAAVGLAQEGKIPFVYSITPFALYRPFETLRNYIEHEKCPVKIVGSGRDKDYEHDGISHWAEDAETILRWALPNIIRLFPKDKKEVPELLDNVIANENPTFISLKR